MVEMQIKLKTDKFKNKLSYAKFAIVLCYMGDHALCRKQSLVCKGKINKSWVTVSKSSYLGQSFQCQLPQRMKLGSMLASQIGCLKLSWTGQSKIAILNKSNALTKHCVVLCLMISPSLDVSWWGAQCYSLFQSCPGCSVQTHAAGVASHGQVKQT